MIGMVRRPKEWEDWTREERMEWLRKQRTQYNGGRKRSLIEKDSPRVWTLLKQHENLSLVADLLGVDRTTVWRFLKKHPTPETFILKEDMQLTDYQEIQTWLKRLKGFAEKITVRNYTYMLKKFYEYMKKKHPERAKPSLWTSEDINEFVFSNPEYEWHNCIVPLRSLALKAQAEFPNIDLGLLPTKRTHKAKRSLAGKEEYYYTTEEIDRMIAVASTKKGKALIAFLYNLAPRTKAVTNARIENLNLKKHRMKIRDKGAIWWDTYGMTDRTAQLLTEYLKERGSPRSGWLFVDGDGESKMTSNEINDLIEDVGNTAEIRGKVLTAKCFRKSLVENFLNIPDANPVVLAGSGKETKTCFCVGWTLDILMKYYAPKMRKQIETHRLQFLF
jgi:predicted DNA-binding transcriptional regulator AlpA